MCMYMYVWYISAHYLFPSVAMTPKSLFYNSLQASSLHVCVCVCMYEFVSVMSATCWKMVQKYFSAIKF
jgi:hypothetical protein